MKLAFYIGEPVFSIGRLEVCRENEWSLWEETSVTGSRDSGLRCGR